MQQTQNYQELSELYEVENILYDVCIAETCANKYPVQIMTKLSVCDHDSKRYYNVSDSYFLQASIFSSMYYLYPVALTACVHYTY